MKTYVIGAFSSGKMAKTYFSTLPNLGDVEVIIIQYWNKEDKFDWVSVPPNVKIIQITKKYPGNTGKHLDLMTHVTNRIEEDAWVFFTDVHDIIFQGPLPELPTDADILVASEGKNFGEIPFWRLIFPQEMYGKMAYNVGCMAMKKDALISFWAYLMKDWTAFHEWYDSVEIPDLGPKDMYPFNVKNYNDKVKYDTASVFNGYFDTLCFNKFIRTKDYRATEIKGLFACYAFNHAVGTLVKKEDQWYNCGELVSIMHFNGDTKEFMMKGGI